MISSPACITGLATHVTIISSATIQFFAGCSGAGHEHDASLTPASCMPPSAAIEAPCFDLQPAAWAANSGVHASEDDSQSMQAKPWQVDLSSEDQVEGFQSLHCTLDSMQLRSIYSLDWHGSMVAAAGKEGWCSLFRVPDVRFKSGL